MKNYASKVFIVIPILLDRQYNLKVEVNFSFYQDIKIEAKESTLDSNHLTCLKMKPFECPKT
jgi:hypothetical protein